MREEKQFGKNDTFNTCCSFCLLYSIKLMEEENITVANQVEKPKGSIVAVIAFSC